MTADELRQASGEMRRLAEAAAPSPWNSGLMGIWSESEDERGGCYIASSVHEHNPCKEAIIDANDRMHIAAWHPAVALAVANWLDTVADACTSPDDVEAPMSKTVGRTIAHVDEEHAHIIARAFLGTTP